MLRVSGEKIDLSLRRVTQKEKKEILEQAKQEKSYKAIFKTILGKEETPKIIEKIEKVSISSGYRKIISLIDSAKSPDVSPSANNLT